MSPFDPPEHVLSRRSLLTSAGLAAAALGGFAGCGDASGDGAAAPAASGATSVTAKAGEIPVGGGKIFADAQTVITQPVAGQFQAFSSICTHARCPVAAVTSTINCNCHGSTFSLTDGSPQSGPATVPLRARTVTVAGDSVTASA